MEFTRKLSKSGNGVKVYLPKEVREALKSELGDQITFVVKDGKVEVVKYEN